MWRFVYLVTFAEKPYHNISTGTTITGFTDILKVGICVA
jgi:hypothetical protein